MVPLMAEHGGALNPEGRLRECAGALGSPITRGAVAGRMARMDVSTFPDDRVDAGCGGGANRPTRSSPTSDFWGGDGRISDETAFKGSLPACVLLVLALCEADRKQTR